MTKNRKHTIVTDALLDTIIGMYQAGTSARGIAAELGFDKGVVRRALIRRGVEARSPGDRNRIYTVNQFAFDNIETEGAAYWLGFLYADGCTHKRTVTLALKAEDGDHVRRFAEFLDCAAPVRETLRSVLGVKHPVTVFSITHDHLTARLVQLGVSKGMRDPAACIASVPARLIHHWLRGIFDGDGSVNTRPSLSFLGSVALVGYVRDLLFVHVGTNPNLKLDQHSSGIRYVRYSGKPQCLRIASFLYRDSTVWLPRKYNRILGW